MKRFAISCHCRLWEKGVITPSTDPKDMRGLIRRYLKGQ